MIDTGAARLATPLAPLKWTRSVRIAADQLWDLMWTPIGQRQWLGAGSAIQLTRGSRCVLTDQAGPWRIGRVLDLRPGLHAAFEVAPGALWSGQPPTRVTIDLCGGGADDTVVSIEETGVAPEWTDDVHRYWTQRLDCLEALVGETRRRRAALRQAVVVIHGIGEQEPGVTLADLARSGVLADGSAPMWVKPDRVSGSYDLHRLTVPASETRPITDVFEFYWAHVIRDTTIGEFGSWLRRLLLRWQMPRPLRPLWVLAWTMVLMLVGLGVAWLVNEPALTSWLARGTVISAMVSAVWALLGRSLTLDVFGDAARYLVPSPSNVAHRQMIRKAGVELLESLHTSGQYDRIVILGHSLGSVIAYDIVTHAWAEMHVEHRRPRTPGFKDIVNIERERELTDPERAQTLQQQAWCCQRQNTQPWLVTDLVTVGSPLTYANLLMAATPERFNQFKADRILPTCPPTPELEAKSGHWRFTYDQPYRDAIEGRNRTFTFFHHAAAFAVTRWTNLYFRVGAIGLTGDLIGGPVAPQFGPWVKDVALDPPRLGVTHTWYWRDVPGRDEHLQALRQALSLESRAELKALVDKLPAVALLGRDRRVE
jgi:hypothetical protein